MKPTVPSLQDRRSGVALVLVLSILVLLTALAIAFFIDTGTELTASKSYSEEARAKLLGNSAVNVVEGQLVAATKGVDVANNPLAWASQPGMVRTYDTSGNGVASYKLYSSTKLTETGTYNSVQKADTEVPPNWNTQPADYVDLNAPVLTPDPDGPIADANNNSLHYSARFPIVDGNNLKDFSSSLGSGPHGQPYFSYMNPTATGPVGTTSPAIDGFAAEKPATYNTSNPLSPINNPVPMPVRWLYVLQDGQLQARADDHSIAGASAANPVVGRVAFWTDDDTCKLNVNTASEGTFWDRPFGKTVTEQKYAQYFPAQNEFQMYPGHPAKTCLSTVFGSIWPVPFTVTANNYVALAPYYDLVPRVTAGGSQGGNVFPPGTSGINYDGERLYASLDEAMFKPTSVNRTTRDARNTAGTASTGTTNANVPAISPQFLETARFFLTASNRAPEVTLLNTPRLSLWPVQAQTGIRTAKDTLLAFCSTINGQPYYFQRATATTGGGLTSGLSCESPTQDFDPTTPSGRRDQQLYSYLQQLTNTNVPGLGGNFKSKYPSGLNRDQLLTEMVDTIRSGVNTSTSTVGYSYTQPRGVTGEGQVVPLQITSSSGTTQGFGRFSTITEAAIDFFRWNPDPISPTATKPPIRVGAVLILQPFNPSPGFPTWSPNMRVEVSGLDQFTITAGASGPLSLLFPADATNIVDNIVGYSTVGGNSEYNGLATMFAYGGNSAKQVGTGSDHSYYPFFGGGTGSIPTSAATFDFSGGANPIVIKIYTNPQPPATPQLVQTLKMLFPPSVGLPIPKFDNAPRTGSPTYSAANPPPTAAAFFNARILTSDGQQNDIEYGGSTGTYASAGDGMIGPDDVVRSIIVNPAPSTGTNATCNGDLRVIAALSNVPTSFFTPHPFYNYGLRGSGSGYGGVPLIPGFDPDTNATDTAYDWQFAHSLRSGDNIAYGGLGWYSPFGNTYQYMCGQNSGPTRKPGWNGPLVPNLPNNQPSLPAYYRDEFPAVPAGFKGAYLYPGNGNPSPNSSPLGDWDSGFGVLEDGPYISKPDEGNNVTVGNTGFNSSSGYYSRGSYNTEGGQTYSPNRQISSAVAFGSLPTGIDPTLSTPVKPWQTLLFCANPAGGLTHPGFGVGATNKSTIGMPAPPYTTIPDHYILDLFTMPIVEPYAISEPLSTQGKVNMNYQVAPFTYLRRDTGVRAVLKSTRLLCIPSDAGRLSADVYGEQCYKEGPAFAGDFRYSINPREDTGTLKGFEDRFGVGDIFHSASEICSIPLVPMRAPMNTDGSGMIKYPTENPTNDPNYTSVLNWWNQPGAGHAHDFELTGDNAREMPYGDLYPRLTTKSNTFTVHVRVQTLKKTPGTAAATFVDPADPAATGPKDAVTAEYRGSYQIERYVDTNNTAIPDYAQSLTSTPLSHFYKIRTISTKQF